jgi:hypothetical protein
MISRHVAMLVALVLPGVSNKRTEEVAAAAPSVTGRWDITVQAGDQSLPSWLEIHKTGRETLVGQFVGPVGSARPIGKIDVAGDEIRFSIPPQWEQEKGDLTFVARIDGERLTGTMTLGDGKRLDWTGKRAPILRRHAAPSWGAPIRLFTGTSLAGWHAAGDNQWRAEGGILRNQKAGANLVTDRKFTDFKLHIEFRYPRGSNSGVYLRGRHEVQIVDSTNAEPTSELLGGVYGFVAPNELVARPPGQWQTFDITLVGRMVTVVANGKRVICDREIPGITGGALDSDEGTPGPIFLQGDHGPVEFRNIVLTPAR